MPSLSTSPSDVDVQAAPLSAADGVLALVASFVVLAPFIRFAGVAGLYDSQRLAELAVLVLGVLLTCTAGGVQAFRYGATLLPGPARLGLLGAVGLGLAASAGAPEPLYALAEVGVYVGLVGLALVLAGHWRESAVDVRGVVEVVAVACAATCAYVVYSNHIASVSSGGAGWPDTTGAFSNQRQLNQVQLIVLPVMLALAARLAGTVGSGLTPRLGTWALRLLSAAHVAAWVASGGRGAGLGFVVGCLVAAVLYKGEVRTVVRETLIAIALGLLAYVLVFEGFGGVGGAFERKTLLSNRNLDWAASLRIVADRPLLGVGPMHYAYFSEINAHPHNVALQLATEWGLPAAGLVLGTMAWGVRRWLGAARQAAARPDRQLWRAALTVALVGSLVSAGFDSFMMAPVLQAWAVLVIAALVVEYERMRQEAPLGPTPVPTGSAPAGAWRVGVSLALVLAVAPPVAVAVRDVPDLDRRVYDRRDWIRLSTQFPRFWAVGTLAPPEGVDTPQKRRYWPAPDGPRR